MRSIRIYTKVPCPYCVAAKNLLNSLGLPHTEIDLTQQPEELIKIKQQSGWATVPIIYFDNELIGGFTDLKALVESNQIWEKLNMAKKN